jgi:hypothetical protein
VAYLSGDPAADLDAGQLAEVVKALVSGLAVVPRPQALAVRLLEASDDSVLGKMFAGDPGLAGALEAGFRPGEGAAGQLRAELEHFYESRFDRGREAVAAGTAQPLVVHPAREFRPALIDPRLAGLSAADGTTARQARAVLYGRRDQELRDALAGLPPVQQARAEWWLGRWRAAAGWSDQARRWLAGDPAVSLSEGGLRELVTGLVTGRPSPSELWLALQLLRTAGRSVLNAVVDAGGQLLGMLDDSIPAGHQLRPELEDVLAKRFHGGREWVARGMVRADGSDSTFIPELLGSPLRSLTLDVELSERVLGRIETAIAKKSEQNLVKGLQNLPMVEQARAARWLSGVWSALDARGDSKPGVMAKLDNALDALVRAAAANVPDGVWLRRITITPSADQVAELRRVLDPAGRVSGPAGNGAARQPFTSQLPGQAKDFRARMREAYHTDIAGFTRINVLDNRVAENRVPERLIPLEALGQIAEVGKAETDRVFGHLAVGRALTFDRPGHPGRLHDQWEAADQQIKSLSPAGRRARARLELMSYLTMGATAAAVMGEHRAVPRFDPDPALQNEEAQVISEVIDGLLNEDRIIDQVLDLYRAWPGIARAGHVYLQRFRARDGRQNQRLRWKLLATSIHEYLHTEEHPRYIAYRHSLVKGTYAYNTLVEGVVSLLTEIVWFGISFAELRQLIEGEYAGLQLLTRK